ncbi:hypothetical protein BBO99_00005118 [Phytophthora kernoviae]|uniref:Cupin 2 conserved barrel domain-containing protein n=2 Tax=Phytophthora kernoviae TaxID=325452 RepID=A0A3R7HWJ1_9STRA|nr:hypothetical protein G195_010646 [Phytophthora kernoviae 00238/432]KAG2510660.1 hypothetical protein JM18_008399 [Phytophthora kernoviae]KAG2510945.1 hypothetical protein JM16_007246 [Phytophthora kernoviae]RLN44332.1 hypothetical protein BBI17_005221 [Phytophthora kernoviae]RLN79658.1 hypothetical protein BBO99_00005118 [Phytophthora kernoviae]
MKTCTLFLSLAASVAALSSASLVVDTAPDELRAYVLPKNMGEAVQIGDQVYRFSVTGPSSGEAFTLLQTSAPESTSLGVLPHIHKTHYENFYCTRGRFQLWAESYNSTGSEQQTRVLTQGDYGAVPHNTYHTFQVLDPDTQMTGVIQPGGFEVLFVALRNSYYNSSTLANFVPSHTNSSAGSNADTISALEEYDVYAQLAWETRSDTVNGTAGSGNWHNGANDLADDGHTPFFVAKNYAQKYLNYENGYKLLAPVQKGPQSGGNFTMGTLTMSAMASNETVNTITPKQPLAFQIEEGQLSVEIEDESALLIQGDVLFVPGNTTFSYHATVPVTKFLYVSAGADGFDYDLLQNMQIVFLFTGVFSTCVAQFVFYQGAGDQKAMLLPLCNYLGMMLVGLLPAIGGATMKKSTGKQSEKKPKEAVSEDPENHVEPERTQTQDESWKGALVIEGETVDMELTRRGGNDTDNQKEEGLEKEDNEDDEDSDSSSDDEKKPALGLRVTSSSVSFSLSTVQLCVVVSVVLDFAGCIFSNVGLAMAGSGLYQVVYSSVICWSALMSRFILKKVVSKEEWFGIALVTFGLTFSALGESGNGRDNTIVLMGCFHTLVGAAFYGGNYVTGEYTLKLAERPHPKELCLKIGAACVTIIAVYQSIIVLPEWDALVTKPIAEANGNTSHIVFALVAYMLSQLAHGLTYFVMLGSSGAVTTGIMQSLRAVCVFVISSLLYCSQQESQCFDTKRGVATLIVVSGVMFYSWAKSQTGKASVLAPPVPLLRRPKKKDSKTNVVAGKNYVV